MSRRGDETMNRDRDGEMDWKDDPRLLAYALGEWAQLGPADVAEIEAALKSDGECRAALEDIRSFIPRIEGAIGAGHRDGEGSRLEPSARSTIADAARSGALELGSPELGSSIENRASTANGAGRTSRFAPMLVAAAGIVAAVGAAVWATNDEGDGPAVDHRMASAPEGDVKQDDVMGRRAQSRGRSQGRGGPLDEQTSKGVVDEESAPDGSLASSTSATAGSRGLIPEGAAPKSGDSLEEFAGRGNDFVRGGVAVDRGVGEVRVMTVDEREVPRPRADSRKNLTVPMAAEVPLIASEKKGPIGTGGGGHSGDAGEAVAPSGGAIPPPSVSPRGAAPASPGVPSRGAPTKRAASKGVRSKGTESDSFQLGARDELVLERKRARSRVRSLDSESPTESLVSLDQALGQPRPVAENPFVDVSKDPFSTFSIDVDTASYTAARGAIERGRLPAPAQVRVEEFVNYFSYDDAPPSADSDEPFAVSAEVGAAPWAPQHRLVRIGLKARPIEFDEREAANVVLLVDVSGSMDQPNKLPLLKKSLGLLTEALAPDDRVAIVVYSSRAVVALDSTPIDAREAILQALERLSAGGSTNGGKGIQLAYGIAREHFVEGGVNRVILCTDGDFNVGVTSAKGLEDLIAEEAAGGIELTVLGFGTSGSSGGDARMEVLSNRGNGNYAALDSELEARKVLAAEVGGTLNTVAKDVKIQVAWNPAVVSHFRLIGYENRMLAHRDFLDDRKDAGEIGAGHGVTALYEVVPVGVAFGNEDLNAYEGVARAEDVPEAAANKSQEPRPFAHAALSDRASGTPLLDVHPLPTNMVCM